MRATPALDLVGCGAVMQTHHAPILLGLRNEGRAEIRACYDLNEAQARAMAERFPGAAFGTTPEAPEGAFACVVASPPESHAELVEAYARVGTHVFVEKPFVVSERDAQKCVDAARAGGSRILVNHLWRFFPSIAGARRLVATGVVGKVRRVEAVQGGRFDWPSVSSYAVASRYGGALWDAGSHLLDATLFILGLDDPATPIEASVSKVTKSPKTEPAQEVFAGVDLATQAGDLHLDVGLSRIRFLATAVKIFGSDGTIVVSVLDPAGPMLKTGDGDWFRVASQDGSTFPKNVRAGFAWAYEELLSLTVDPTRESVLDAGRFLNVTALLERLASHDG